MDNIYDRAENVKIGLASGDHNPPLHGAIPPNSADPATTGTDAIFDNDQRLIANGYEPIAVTDKRGVGDEWSSRPNTIEAVAAERACHPYAVSTGLRTGPLVGLDIDIVNRDQVAAIKRLAAEVLGFTPMERVGSKGAMLCYRNETPIRKVVVSGLDTDVINRKVEILGTGQQFVAYGIHPDTKRPYDWPNAVMGFEPLHVAVAQLVEVTPDQLREFARRAAALFAELGYREVKVTDRGEHAAARDQKRREDKVPVAREELIEVLGHVAPDCDRNTWIGFLGGIQATNLRDVAPEDMDAELLEIAQAWSRGDYSGAVPGNWTDDDDVDGAFWSLDPMKPGGTTFGSLYHAARENGYTKPPPQPTDAEVFGKVERPADAPAEKSGATDATRQLDPWKPPRVRLASGAGVRSRKVDWLWPGYFALGKYAAFGGGKGAGKSTIIYDLGARVTAGGKWPDGTPAPLGDFLVWSSEDDFEDTILPRFLLAGGDPARLYRVQDVVTGGERRPFDPAHDIPGLVAAARELPDLKLILIDPIVSAVAGDSHKNAETRRGLQPLVDLAQDCHAALVGITHFSKNTQGRDPIERITGSLAFGALARIVLGAAKGDDEEAARRFVRIASNIGEMGGGFEYLLRQARVPGEDFTAQQVIWGKPLTGSAKDLLEACETQSARLSAIVFVEQTLRGNGRTMMVKDLKEAAEAHGHSWPTIKRAKADMGSRIRTGQNLGAQHGGWFWTLADDDAAQPATGAKPW